MTKEEIKDYITELESVFELSELEEHRINILKVGIYINQLQQENQKYKEVIDKVKFAIKTNCINNDKKYEEICCDGDYLLQILEDKEVK